MQFCWTEGKPPDDTGHSDLACDLCEVTAESAWKAFSFLLYSHKIWWILDWNPRMRDLIKECSSRVTTLISRLILAITWDILWACSEEPCWQGVPYPRCCVFSLLQAYGKGLVQEPKTPGPTFSTGRKVTHTKRFHWLENIPWCGFIHHILVECSKENRRFFSRDDTDNLRSEALWSREQVSHVCFSYGSWPLQP